MLKIKHLYLVIISFIISVDAIAEINLSTTVSCTYQSGQILDKKEAKNVESSYPLNWTFNGLLSKKPIFVSGGDTSAVIAIPIDNGIAIYLPSSAGTSTFTIWETGESFWSKQVNIVGNAYSQQYLGTCEN